MTRKKALIITLLLIFSFWTISIAAVLLFLMKYVPPHLQVTVLIASGPVIGALTVPINIQHYKWTGRWPWQK